MKNTFRNLFVILIVGLAACSCTTTYRATLNERDVFSPEGKTYSELVSIYGLPTREANVSEEAYIVTFTGSNVFNYRPSKFGQLVPELQCVLY